MKNVRIHAVVTGNDGTTGGTSPTFTTGFTEAKLISLVAEIETIFSKFGIKILFDPRTDITELHNALLNEDVQFLNGQIVAPPMSVDDLTGNPNVVAQREFAENLEGSLVIYFRDFSDAKYSYINAAGESKRDTPWHFSGSKHLYVRYSKSTESDRLTHEMGHYFHLGHTFGPAPKTVAEAAKLIKTAVENGTFSKNDGALVFDGDRHSGILDTPPDPRGALFQTVNGGNACGPVDTVNVPVTFTDGSTKTYKLKPDRQNVMSYFQACADTNTARFSNDQMKRISHVIDTDNRNHLISHSAGRYTVVMQSGNEDERFIFAWKYKYFRMKYDELWKDGWRLHTLENHVHQGEVLYTASFRKSNVPEIQLYGWSYASYRKKYDELWKKGWRLHILNNYVINGKVRYTAVFRKSKAAEIQLYGWLYSSYRKKYDKLWDQGWRLHILNNYEVNGKVRYTAVFRKSKAAEIQLYGWAYDAYRERYDELWKKGWRLHILNNYVVGGNVKYTAVFRKSSAGEKQLYGWKYLQFREKFQELWEQGLRVKILNVY
jgi:hypothetical protein